MYITDINVNDEMVASRPLVDIFQGLSSMKPHILF